jgi:hypothetical protein
MAAIASAHGESLAASALLISQLERSVRLIIDSLGQAMEDVANSSSYLKLISREYGQDVAAQHLDEFRQLRHLKNQLRFFGPIQPYIQSGSLRQEVERWISIGLAIP